MMLTAMCHWGNLATVIGPVKEDIHDSKDALLCWSLTNRERDAFHLPLPIATFRQRRFLQKIKKTEPEIGIRDQDLDRNDDLNNNNNSHNRYNNKEIERDRHRNLIYRREQLS
jgi:hypothetical protein